MTTTERARRELEAGLWADQADEGAVLVALHCLFDGRVLLASSPVFSGQEHMVPELRADLLACEGMTEAEASWVVAAP
jgi:hypothetical protein